MSQRALRETSLIADQNCALDIFVPANAMSPAARGVQEKINELAVAAALLSRMEHDQTLTSNHL
jgi:hypothetical protein